MTPLLCQLHWLRARERITFKVATLAFQCLHGTAPSYLSADLHRVADMPARSRLRSASTMALAVPRARLSTVGDRAFPVAAARTQNSLPADVTTDTSLRTFRKHLKTYLFTRSFS